jgi:hypothetical protein
LVSHHLHRALALGRAHAFQLGTDRGVALACRRHRLVVVVVVIVVVVVVVVVAAAAVVVFVAQ